MPLVEAMGGGVPAICSDIPAFREAGQDMAEYISPLDSVAWREAILDYMAPDSKTRAAQVDRLRNYVIPTWEKHFKEMDKVLGFDA